MDILEAQLRKLPQISTNFGCGVVAPVVDNFKHIVIDLRKKAEVVEENNVPSITQIAQNHKESRVRLLAFAVEDGKFSFPPNVIQSIFGAPKQETSLIDRVIAINSIRRGLE